MSSNVASKAEVDSGERVKRRRLDHVLDPSEAVRAGIAAGNIDVSEGDRVEMENLGKKRELELLAHFERKKLIKSIVVPTDDKEVCLTIYLFLD